MSEIKDCISEQMGLFFDDLSLGSETCPFACANCFTDPLSCLEHCTNKDAACGCAEALPKAISSVSQCCEEVWSMFQSACESGLRGLEETVLGQISRICQSWEEGREATLGADLGPGVLVEEARRTVQESTTAFLVGLQAAAERHPGASALLDLQPLREEELSAACLNMLERVEGGHAEAAGEGDNQELPDRELSALEDEVREAVATARSKDGAGMDPQDICKKVLRHHDSL